MADDGYAVTYKELIETTDWKKYGHKSGNPKCANCMVHVGFEPSAVNDVFDHPLQALKSAMGWRYGVSPQPTNLPPVALKNPSSIKEAAKTA